MDVPDCALVCNHDWDPSYLSTIFDSELEDLNDIFSDSISDMDLVEHVEQIECYCPVVEDILLDDVTLCQAVEQIEQE